VAILKPDVDSDCSVYQEYLTKNLTDKNAVLNTQMDQVINDANAEILRLRNKLSGTAAGKALLMHNDC